MNKITLKTLRKKYNITCKYKLAYKYIVANVLKGNTDALEFTDNPEPISKTLRDRGYVKFKIMKELTMKNYQLDIPQLTKDFNYALNYKPGGGSYITESEMYVMIQEHAFKIGFHWPNRTQKIMTKTKKYIYLISGKKEHTNTGNYSDMITHNNSISEMHKGSDFGYPKFKYKKAGLRFFQLKSTEVVDPVIQKLQKELRLTDENFEQIKEDFNSHKEEILQKISDREKEL